MAAPVLVLLSVAGAALAIASRLAKAAMRVGSRSGERRALAAAGALAGVAVACALVDSGERPALRSASLPLGLMRFRASMARSRVERMLRALRDAARALRLRDFHSPNGPPTDSGRPRPEDDPEPIEPFAVENASMCVNLNQCDLHCIMCWTLPDRERQRKGHLPLDPMNMPRERLLEFLRTPEIQALPSLSVVGGGEPFVYPFIGDLLREGPTPTRRLMIMTHGGLIHRTEALWQAAESASITLTFSIDAATEQTYSEIRRGGNWSQLVENVNRYAEACRANPSAHLNASFVVLQRNLDEVLPFLELCVRWGARYVHFHPAIAGAYPEEWRVDRGSDHYLGVMREAFEFTRAAGIWLDSPEELLTSPALLEGASRSEAAVKHPVDEGKEALDPRRSCRLHTESMTISHLGEVFVCDTAFRIWYSCGNVFEGGIAGAWKSSAWSSLRRAHREGRPEEHPLCRNCLLLR